MKISQRSLKIINKKGIIKMEENRKLFNLQKNIKVISKNKIKRSFLKNGYEFKKLKILMKIIKTKFKGLFIVKQKII